MWDFLSIWDNTRFASYSRWCSHHSWIFNVYAFNNEKEISIAIDNAQLHPKRVHDRALMELAAEYLTSAGDLRAFNIVSMLHNVVSLSNVTFANGRGIDHIYTHSSAFEGCKNEYEWPSKHHTGSGDFTTWRKTLEFLFPNEQLAIPLGNWILGKPTDWLDLWDWFVTLDGQFLYFRNGPSVWYRFLWRPNSHRTYFAAYLVEDTPSVPLHRATIEGDVDVLYLLNSSGQHIPRATNTLEMIQLGELQVSAPIIPWITAYLHSSPSIQ